MKKKYIGVILIIILGGVFLAKYTMPYNFVISDTKTDKKGIGVLISVRYLQVLTKVIL